MPGRPPPSPFSSDAIKHATDEVEARPGNTVDVGVESAPGEKPILTVEAQGGERLTWGLWIKTRASKASTALGAKIGFKW